MMKNIIDIIAEHIVTFLNTPNKRIEVSAGNIKRLEINSVPINRIPTTIVNAVTNASSKLYLPVLIPVALAKSESNVTAKILS